MGAWTSIGHPVITEIFAAARVDFIGIDLEHSTIGLEQAQEIIAAAQAGGAACWPRVSSHNGEQIKRLLDSGADGIIVPMVCTAAEVQQIVEWAKYPPVGRRSYGVARAQNYGFDFAEYTREWNARSSIIIQIEAISAVNAIDELLSHDAVDGAMIGPYDMSGSLGIPGQISDPRVTEACARVVAACRRHGKACGTQIVDVTEQAVADAFKSGFTFVVLSSDIFILWKWAERVRAIVNG
jgi:2-dehydro-3-deoxyglucarate aldolase